LQDQTLIEHEKLKELYERLDSYVLWVGAPYAS